MSPDSFASFLGGALWIASMLAGLVFLSYWRISRDRLFVFFALAFWVMGLQWLCVALATPAEEHKHYYFLMRLCAFVLIIVGIVDKNRRAPTG